MLVFLSGGGVRANRPIYEQVLRSAGRAASVCYIPSKSEGSHPYFQEFKSAFRTLGVRNVRKFSIDNRILRKRDLLEAFKREIVFLSGGNTFYFLKQIKRAGLGPFIRDYVRREGILVGESAGSIIMTPSIEVAGLVPGESDRNLFGLKDLKGLNLSSFEVFPHYRATTRSKNLLTKRSKGESRIIYAIPDGAGIIMDEISLTFFGDIVAFAPSHTVKI